MPRIKKAEGPKQGGVSDKEARLKLLKRRGRETLLEGVTNNELYQNIRGLASTMRSKKKAVKSAQDQAVRVRGTEEEEIMFSLAKKSLEEARRATSTLELYKKEMRKRVEVVLSSGDYDEYYKKMITRVFIDGEEPYIVANPPPNLRPDRDDRGEVLKITNILLRKVAKEMGIEFSGWSESNIPSFGVDATFYRKQN